MSTGISVTVFTSSDELIAARKGASVLLGKKAKGGYSDIQISVPLEACEFGGADVRVNIELIKKQREELGNEMGVKMGEAMGAELQKVMTAMMAEG